ncbi:MAG: serine/threonine-protein kinase [Gemmatimonadaceae bacterium]
MTAAKDLPAGTIIRDRYRIEAVIGRGSFGTTYRAIDLERFDEPRVIKRLHSHLERVERARDLFAREARVLAGIDHPLIPRLHHFFVHDDEFHLVEDYVAGEAWDLVIKRRGPITEREACNVALDVLDALIYLHTRDPIIIHRDIKPSNLIRRAADGRTMLIDFGGVREVLDDESGTVIGTPAFAPPEQEKGKPIATSDLYALGATLLQLVTGKPPHAWHDLITGEIRLAGRIPGTEAFGAAIARLFALVENRYSSASEARRDFASLTSGNSTAGAQEIGTSVSSTINNFSNPSVIPAAVTAVAVSVDADSTTLHVRNIRDDVAAPAYTNSAAVGTSASLPRARNTLARPLKLTIASAIILVACSGILYVYANEQRSPVESPDQVTKEKSRYADKNGVSRISVDTSASGIVLELSHPIKWVVSTVAKNSPTPLRYKQMGVYPSAGMMAVQLPLERGLFLINMDLVPNETTRADEYIQNWVRRTFREQVTADSAKLNSEGVYQATLRATDGRRVIGFWHIAMRRSPNGLLILSRCFVGEINEERDAIHVVQNALRVP